jgi:hypothetical protein
MIIAQQTRTIQYALAWCTAEWPPPPRRHSMLSENVRVLVSHNSKPRITIACYSHATNRWLVAGQVEPSYWQPK